MSLIWIFTTMATAHASPRCGLRSDAREDHMQAHTFLSQRGPCLAGHEQTLQPAHALEFRQLECPSGTGFQLLPSIYPPRAFFITLQRDGENLDAVRELASIISASGLPTMLNIHLPTPVPQVSKLRDTNFTLR